ncbi:MAG TPA: hypothetical protein VMN03_00590 [Burkholderiales bacterium]|nr:hypothetical protein [Burkholderiales bacterium]
MSLSWRNQLRIGLSPDRLIFAAYRGGLRPGSRHRIAASGIVAVDASGAPGPHRRSSDQPLWNWQAAVDALPSALAAAAPGKPQATVILSNHFVRYAVLPWNAALNSGDEWLAYARHRMESVHGHAVAEWDLRVSATTRNGARMVCATDRALLEAVGARIAESGAELVSVQPYLMTAFNRMRERLETDACWLVLDEPGRLTLALIRDGGWCSIRSRRVNGDWRRNLPDILERESATLALEAPCTEVAIHSTEPFDFPLPGEYRLRDLTLPHGTPATGQPLAMALQ